MFSMAARESEVLASIKQYLDLKGIFYFRVNQIPVPLPGGGFRRFDGMKGVSDIVAVIPPYGKICCIEIKSKYGKESDDQEIFSSKVTELGGISIVAHSVEELENDLRMCGALSDTGQVISRRGGKGGASCACTQKHSY